MRVVLLLAALALSGISAVLIVSAGGTTETSSGSQAAPVANGCGVVDYDRYDAGAAVSGIRKTDTVNRCEPDVGAPTRINMVAAMYGSCEPTSDSGCAPRVQVQSWPACERNLELYERYPSPDGSTVDYTRTTIRGVPAAIFDSGRRIEVYTGDATVVIFGESAGLTRAAANRLSGVHGGRVVRETGELPAPADGALAGKLSC